MVNKQYTIQHQQNSQNSNRNIRGGGNKRSSPLPIRNFSIISDIPNPNIIATIDDPLCRALEHRFLDPIPTSNINSTSSQPSSSTFGRNLTLHNRYFSKNRSIIPEVDSNHNKSPRNNKEISENENCDEDDRQRFVINDLSINDIGHFQYILQMDREMKAHNQSLYGITTNKEDSLNSNSMNSTNYMMNFWKSGSETPISPPSHLSNFRRRHHEIYRNLKDFWKHGKWPFLIIFACLILSTIICFIVLNQKNTKSSNKFTDDDQKYFAANYSRKNDEAANDIVRDKSKNQDIKTDYKIKSTAKTTESTTTGAASTEIDELITFNDDFFNEKIEIKEISTAIPVRNTQILKITKIPSIFEDETVVSTTTEKILLKDLKTLVPTKDTLQQTIGFTSGHQNNFGVPIEEDERILRILNEELIKVQGESTTDDRYIPETSTFKPKVSPTLPFYFHGETSTHKISAKPNTTDVGVCESTSLAICRGVLQYDLTSSNARRNLSHMEIDHFKYLMDSKCSMRAAEFVCSALEPECRPTQMGVLQPCKRICKSILEPCSSIIASSEILTMTFDCDSYPDSSDRNVCEDPTRRGKCHSTEFQCLDSTCIPLQWKCDNIKDCSLGEDEENCKFCAHDEVRCQSTNKCIAGKFRCDQYNDCPDGSDEIDCEEYDENENDGQDDYASGGPRIYSFLSVQSPDNPTGRAFLTISGEDRDLDDVVYEDANADDEDGDDDDDDLEDDVVPTAEINDENIANASMIDDGTTEMVEESPKGEESSQIGTILPKNIANFQDSKELMMTSDSERTYKFTPSNRSRISSTTRSSTSTSTSTLRSVSVSTTRTTARISTKLLPTVANLGGRRTLPSRITTTGAPLKTTATTITKTPLRTTIGSRVTSSTTTKATTPKTTATPSTTHRTSTTSSISTESSTKWPPDSLELTTSEGSLCLDDQLRCVSGKCITVAQICDKIVDCPDGADEKKCTYKD